MRNRFLACYAPAPPMSNMDANTLANFGAWGVVVAVLLWQQGVIKTLLQHQTELVDRLVDKVRFTNGSNHTADKPSMEMLPPTSPK